MKYTLLLLAVLPAGGCGSGPTKTYSVRVIRPDGGVHKTHTIDAHGYPAVTYSHNGMTHVYGASESLDVPVGWLVEIEPATERRYSP